MHVSVVRLIVFRAQTWVSQDAGLDATGLDAIARGDYGDLSPWLYTSAYVRPRGEKHTLTAALKR